MTLVTFSAPVVPGAGRGKQLGAPTINVDPQSIPSGVREGIYAGYLIWGGQHLPAAIHYGPRPVFHDSISFEIHTLDSLPFNVVPPTVEIKLVSHLRDVRDFPSPEALMTQIRADIAACRAILKPV